MEAAQCSKPQSWQGPLIQRAEGCESCENLCTPELKRQKAKKADFTAPPSLPHNNSSAPSNHWLMLKEAANEERRNCCLPFPGWRQRPGPAAAVLAGVLRWPNTTKPIHSTITFHLSYSCYSPPILGTSLPQWRNKHPRWLRINSKLYICSI